MLRLRSLLSSSVAGAWLALLCATVFSGAVSAQAQQPAPVARVRIVERIDESNLATLRGNTHPSANANNDRGRVASSLPMSDLILVLSRSPEQQAAFESFVASQYDSASPNFHKWLTPEQMGANYGPAETDLATVTTWLTGRGFSIDEVGKDRMTIRFSGTATQVESAFHTEIHNLEVRGVQHIGNMSDPQIPAALTSVVVGVKALHNFFAHPLHHVGSAVTRDQATGKWLRPAASASTDATSTVDTETASVRPQFGINVPASSQNVAYLVEDVAPYDFATIYNILPLWNAASPIDGTGQTIAIAGTSSISLSDVATFRATFGLPTSNKANTPILQSGNGQPLRVCTTTSTSAYCNIDDLVENALDVEWSGAVAKNAQIVLVASSQSSNSDDTLYDSESYIVNNISNAASPVYGVHVMNVSYGECEAGEGTAGNVQYYNLWQQAAAEGLAVFVASGDSGSASCDQGGDSSGVPYAAKYGLSVSGLASTPYNTAVGGTDFNWCSMDTTWNGSECTAAPYWSSSNYTSGASALGYIPETPWNDTCTNPLALSFISDIADYLYALTNVNSTESACNFIWNKSSYLRHWSGGGMLYFDDTVGGSGGASNCVVTDNSGNCTTGASTTGAGNGSIPLYNNGWPKPSWQTGVPGIPSDGVRDIPDVSFFASDGFISSSAYLVCVSAVTPCVYSTKVVPTQLEVGGTSVATPAMAGVMALINQKVGTAQGNPNAQLYELASKQTYSNCSAESVTNSGSCYFNDIDSGNNAVPCTAGTPNCTVLYSGDKQGILSGYNAGTGYDLATGLGSLNVANVVNHWPLSIGSTAATVTAVLTPATTMIANQSLSVAVTVASKANGGATPTGSVTLSGGGYTSATEALTSGAYTFTVPSDSLSAGNDSLTISYSGDPTYAPASTSASLTVTKLTPTVTVAPTSTTLNSNQQQTVLVTVTGTGGAVTGNVTISVNGYTSATEPLTSGAYSFTIPYNVLAGPSGNYTLSATYSGDKNYTAANGSVPVTVNYVVPLAPTVLVTPATIIPESGQNLAVTVTVTGSGVVPTGSVNLSGGGYALTTQALALVAGVPTATFTIPANTLGLGPQTLAAAYTGDTNYASGNNVASITVSASAFTLAATTPAAVAPGASATSTITVATTTGYEGSVLLSCALTSPTTGSYLPTCSANQTVSLTASTTTTPATFTVSTTGSSSAMLAPNPSVRSRGWAGGGAVLALLFFLGLPKRRRNWHSLLGALILAVALGALAGCGGTSATGSGGTTGPPVAGTAAGNYTFTVTATGTPAGSPAPKPVTFVVTVN